MFAVLTQREGETVFSQFCLKKIVCQGAWSNTPPHLNIYATTDCDDDDVQFVVLYQLLILLP